MSTDTNQPPVWDAPRIAALRDRCHQSVDVYTGEVTLKAETIRSLLDELAGTRRDRDRQSELVQAVGGSRSMVEVELVFSRHRAAARDGY